MAILLMAGGLQARAVNYKLMALNFKLYMSMDVQEPEQMCNSIYEYVNPESPIEVEQVLIMLDSFGQSYGLAHECLTQSNPVFLSFLNQPDSINGWKRLISIGELYNHFAPFSTKDSLLYMAVADYWLGAVKDDVSTALENNPKLIREFEYQYLIERLGENKFSVKTPKPSSVEKAFDNFSKGRFGYVLNRFWLDSPWYIVLLAVLGFIISLIGLFSTVTIIKKIVK